MQLTVTFLRIILGVMAGMSRDKCGSGVVAGFLHCVAKLKPKGIKVIGGMAMVSQSICIALLSLITLLTSSSFIVIQSDIQIGVSGKKQCWC